MADHQHHHTATATRHGPGIPALLALLLVGALVTFFPSCSSKAPEYLSADAKRGWKAYRRHCVLCHNPNPFEDSRTSPQGPPIARSSKELLEMRVKSIHYPKGYKPKRDTKLMYPLPQAVPDVPYIYAYLQEVRKDG